MDWRTATLPVLPTRRGCRYSQGTNVSRVQTTAAEPIASGPGALPGREDGTTAVSALRWLARYLQPQRSRFLLISALTLAASGLAIPAGASSSGCTTPMMKEPARFTASVARGNARVPTGGSAYSTAKPGGLPTGWHRWRSA